MGARRSGLGHEAVTEGDVNQVSDDATATLEQPTVTEDRVDATETAAAPRSRWSFKEWRRSRPFWSGLLLICAGVVIIVPAYLSFKIMDILVVISTISGVSTLILGVLLIMFGIGTWLTPPAAPYLGVLSIIVGVVALPTSNFGGFLVGTILAIVGGALALAWEDANHPNVVKARARKERRAAEKARKREARAASSNADEAPAATENPRSGSTSLRSAAGVSAVALAAAGLVAAPTLHDAAWAQTPNPNFTGATTGVTADEVTVSGNARVALVTVETQQGPMRMIELSGNTVKVNNIGFGIPGESGVGVLETGPGMIATLTGSPAILRTRTLTATPVVAGVPAVPVTVDAQGNLEEVGRQLEALGVTSNDIPTVPDELVQFVALRDVKMDALGVTAGVLEAPGVTLTAPQ